MRAHPLEHPSATRRQTPLALGVHAAAVPARARQAKTLETGVKFSPFDLYGVKGRDIWKPYGQNYETTPGTGPAEQRLKEQEIDGIDAEVLFPGQASGPYFWRYIRDAEVYKACVRVYNDFLAEDYCAADSNRLLGLGVIPMTNLQDALTELEHLHKLGLKGAMLGIFPSGKGQPTPEDGTFWQAAGYCIDGPPGSTQCFEVKMYSCIYKLYPEVHY